MAMINFDSFDSEVIQLIQDLDLVQVGSPEFRLFLAERACQNLTTFDFQFELDLQSRLAYIMHGLNPRFRAFRKKQDELTACRQTSFDF